MDWSVSVGKSVLLAQRLTVVPVDNDHVLVDDDGGIAAVFDEICFQSVELLRAQRREQLSHLRQDHRAAFSAGICDPGIFHQAATSQLVSSSISCASSSTLRGERNSTSLALMRKPG